MNNVKTCTDAKENSKPTKQNEEFETCKNLEHGKGGIRGGCFAEQIGLGSWPAIGKQRLSFSSNTQFQSPVS